MSYFRRLCIWFKKPKEKELPKQWKEWAEELPKSAFIIWLANNIANTILSNKPRNHSYQQLIDSVDEDMSCMEQHGAERFIEMYYFGYPSFDPKKYKLIKVFRRLIQRKIIKCMNSKKHL